MAGENQTSTLANPQNPGKDAHPAAQRQSWMDLTPEGRSQVSATKWFKVQKPEKLMADAKIYHAMQNMSYKVHKAMEAYEEFIRDVRHEIGVKENTRGSPSKLDRIVEKYWPLQLSIPDSTVWTYNCTFMCEAEKLRNPPALMSNFALVHKYECVRRKVL
ncbi:hypothetical protein L218DRAFT_1002605 [Marasmius fiardii PR-910]|nr:hypothetical protein L218DRAFT_1002605 [Marasmius fiardii PR-910]